MADEAHVPSQVLIGHSIAHAEDLTKRSHVIVFEHFDISAARNGVRHTLLVRLEEIVIDTAVGNTRSVVAYVPLANDSITTGEKVDNCLDSVKEALEVGKSAVDQVDDFSVRIPVLAQL